MGEVLRKVGLEPDVINGAFVVKVYGDEFVIVENFNSILEYDEHIVKIIGKKLKLEIVGDSLEMECMVPDECQVVGRIKAINYSRIREGKR